MAHVAHIKLYADRAAKFESKPKVLEVPSAKPEKRGNIFEDYFANSTIHGFRYFVGANRTYLERAWWVFACILSIYFCGQTIQEVFEKWRRSPVVVTFDEKPTPITDIPFPAITVCPVTKVKSAEINFTIAYQTLIRRRGKSNISEDDLDRVHALIQICDFSFANYKTAEAYDDNLVELLQEMALPFRESFIMCVWKNKLVNCSDLFMQTLTESGICYTFNGLSADDLLRRTEFHREFEHMGERRSSENWTMEDGYKPGIGSRTYPRRVMSPGAQSGLLIFLRTGEQDMDFLCGNSFQGFQVQLHSPNQVPQISTQNIRAPMNIAFQVRVQPFMITTAGNLRAYDAEKRGCFYTHERYLRFFNIYTKRNCEVECLTNLTLALCGCVHFSMPRPANVRICGLGKQACMERVDTYVQEQEMESKLTSGSELSLSCNCLPSCTFLQYNAEISQAQFDWRRLTDAVGIYQDQLTNASLTTLNIYFREAQFIGIRRSQMFGINDFIANCGGLLGLFMGVSLLSLLELVYYFTMKPLVNCFLRHRNQKRKIAIVKSQTGQPDQPNSLYTFLRDAA
ncbi:pickpocket protein 28-like [Anopheles albimanus]|uniref:pickpocket protein 28-like n=1 Tax=Anopheles albimanus TaxID=7167 RepID=UPI00163F1569|nr:pickpocket protein 28-like [Anopheles albimanus]